MRGFTLVELLIALALTLLVSAGVVWVMDEAQRHMVVQPEVSDLGQRGRVAVSALERALALAGAGPQRGEAAGALIQWIPPIHPDRRWDLARGVPSIPSRTSFTVLRVPEGAAQAMVEGEMGSGGDVVRLRSGGVCEASGIACGFEIGQRALVFDELGRFDLFTVLAVAPRALSHRPSTLGRAYREAERAMVSEVVATMYYYDEGRRQVRRSLGDGDDTPVVDEVVGMSVEYFGDPFPPDRPRPSSGQANCLFDEAGVRRLPELTPSDGALVPLAVEQLSDGPFCGEGAQRFDVDLYRLRRVRVAVRVQVAAEWLRGRDALLFRLPGTARGRAREVPDLDVRFDVSPRNLQVR